MCHAGTLASDVVQLAEDALQQGLVLPVLEKQCCSISGSVCSWEHGWDQRGLRRGCPVSAASCGKG